MGAVLKYFVTLLALIVGAGLVSGVLLEQRLRSWFDTSLQNEMAERVAMARDVVEIAPSLAQADRLADRLGRSSRERVTIIDGDGVVIGDSELTLEQLGTVENHGSRQEVRSALATGVGMARRYSRTVKMEMLYVAQPYERGVERGVVRLSKPLAEVELAVDQLRWVLLVAGLVGLVLAVLISGLASYLVAKPLRRLVAGLASERDRLETILEGMTEAVLAVGPDQVVTAANSASRTLLAAPSLREGKRLDEVAQGLAITEWIQAFQQSGKESDETELALPEERVALVRAARLRTTGGLVVVMLDVTEIRKLEEVRRDFVANVSHELRTPVSVIQANAETLMDGALEDPVHGPEFVRAIYRSAQRQAQLVRDLLDLSRIESGHASLEPVEIVIPEFVPEVVAGLEGVATEKGIELAVSVPEGLRICADPGALEQVLTNLTENALKYTPRGGRVKVKASVSKKPGHIEIAVSDTGPGIEMRHRRRIFERFYRVDPGRSREMGGTGLGLAIVKHLVVSMQGTVLMTGRKKGGSVFRVTLPTALPMGLLPNQA